MRLSSDMEERFVDEVNLVVKNMKATNSFSEKLYFYSAVYAQAQRVINFEYDPEMVCILQVCQLVYGQINSRLQAISEGRDKVIQIPSRLFDDLQDALTDLVSCIKSKKETYMPLQKMLNIAFCTTGNGYYLYLKEVAQI